MERIEFNALTNMSKGSLVSPIKLIEQAISLGQDALAITDFNNVRAFPVIGKYLSGNHITNFKVIYGVKVKMLVNESLVTINIIVRNIEGLKNLYKIISLISKNNLVLKKRVISKEDLVSLSEGLLYGLDLNKMLDIYDNLSREDIANDMMWYDFIMVRSDERNQDKLKSLINLAREYRKIVIGTSEVCYLEKEDRSEFLKIYGDDLDATHLKSTEELMADFSFLDSDIAYDIVTRNPHLLSDLVDDNILIYDNHTYLPKIKNSKKILKDEVYKKARLIYGDKLPKEVESRIKLELYGQDSLKNKGIIGSNYEVIYLISKKLVDYSKDLGYQVMTRGGVGSSLIAYLLGITDINPLPMHYYCKDCHEFYIIDEDKYKTFHEMPDRICKCGKKLLKDGYNIPSELFLGYDLTKRPQIDINYAVDIKDKLEEYLKKLLKENTVIRASSYNSKEVSGINPGGFMIFPDYVEVEDFTPLEYLKEEVTTHFDYHDLERNILKINLLYHDIPTLLSKVKKENNYIDYTNVSKYSYLLGLEHSKTFEEIVKLLKPKTYYDYILTYGLSYENLFTDYKELLINQKITINDIIVSREDLYDYLRSLKIDSKTSFQIADYISKGKKEHWNEILEYLKTYKVKDYYLDIFAKITYLPYKVHLISYINSYLEVLKYKDNDIK